MKLVLKKRVPKLGDEWDIITVKDGYARNYLLPKRLADPATPSLLKIAEKFQSERVKKLEEIVANAKEMAEKLKDTELKFTKKTRGEKLYGSIGEKDIVAALADNYKIEVSKGMVKMKEHIKTVGEHKVILALAEGVEVKIKVIVEEEK